MNQMKRLFSIHFLLIVFFIPLFGMNEVRFAPEQKVTPSIVQAINDTTDKGTIVMEGSFINNTQIIDALKSAKNRGVAIKLLVAKKKENKALEADFKECMYVHHGMHTKRCIVCKNGNPADQVELITDEINQVIFTGSENQSNNAGNHHEYTIIEQDKNIIKEHYIDFLFNITLAQLATKKYIKPAKIPESNKENVPISPRSPKIFNSQLFKSGLLKAARIAKPIPRGMTEKIYLSSMGFDQPDVAKALIEKAKAGSEVLLVLHKSVLKSRNRALIKKMHEAGVDVRVWMGSNIQHTKLLVRERLGNNDSETDDVLCVTSTGNLVKQSETEINYDLITPKDKRLARKLRNYLVQLADKCERFDDIDFKAFDEKYAQKNYKKYDGPKDEFHYYIKCPDCGQSFQRLLQGPLVSSFLAHRKKEHGIDDKILNKTFIDNNLIHPKKLKKYILVCSQNSCKQLLYSFSSASKVKSSLAKHLQTKKHGLPENEAKKLVKSLIPEIKICDNLLSK